MRTEPLTQFQEFRIITGEDWQPLVEMSFPTKLSSIWQQAKQEYLDCGQITDEMIGVFDMVLAAPGEDYVKLDVFCTVKSYLQSLERFDPNRRSPIFSSICKLLELKLTEEIYTEQKAIISLLLNKFSSELFGTIAGSYLFLNILECYPELSKTVLESLMFYFECRYEIRVVNGKMLYGNTVYPDQRGLSLFSTLMDDLYTMWVKDKAAWVKELKLVEKNRQIINAFFAEVSVLGITLTPFDSPLGEGSFSLVYDFPYTNFTKPPMMPLVLKVFKIGDLNKIEKEAVILRTLDSPWIIKMVGFYPGISRGIFLEKWGIGLDIFLAKTRRISLKMITAISLQLMSALISLKERNVVHCDLKPENILIDPVSLELRLGDLGLATFAGLFAAANHIATRWYRPPELVFAIDSHVEISSNIDSWSAGCVLTELFTRNPLFKTPAIDSSFGSSEEYRIRMQRMFNTVLLAPKYPHISQLGLLLCRAVTLDEQQTPLFHKISKVVTGLLSMDPNRRMPPLTALNILKAPDYCVKRG